VVVVALAVVCSGLVFFNRQIFKSKQSDKHKEEQYVNRIIRWENCGWGLPLNDVVISIFVWGVIFGYYYIYQLARRYQSRCSSQHAWKDIKDTTHITTIICEKGGQDSTRDFLRVLIFFKGNVAGNFNIVF
jgi:hypothetical protein